MLQHLLIKNIALIEDLEISLSSGLNVITGETGTGKTILINALELVLGGRASAECIRSGEAKAKVEAQFDLSHMPDLQSTLAEHGLDGDSGEQLILKRQFIQDGKSSSYINSSLVSMKTLEEIGQRLVDIHGQHQHQLLLNPDKHLDFLDAFGDLSPSQQQLKQLYDRWQTKRNELNQLIQQNEVREERRQLLEFQLKEIDSAQLRDGEEEELKAEKQILLNAERIAECGQFVYQNLYESEGAILERLAQVQDRLQRLANIDLTLKPQAESTESISYQLQEIAMEIRRYLEKIEYDPVRLQAVEDRLAEIEKLERKYGSPLIKVLDYRQQITSELKSISGLDDQQDALSHELKTLTDQLNQLATELSARRKKAGQHLEQTMSSELSQFGMQKARFCCQINSQPIQPEIYAGNDQGTDKVEFFFSANPGEPPRPLVKIASGGELSRIMLALKTLLRGGGQVSTLVFDEVDTGIGGKEAGIVGRKLKDLGASHQVICITHLPQIAALASHHYTVRKQMVSSRMQIQVEKLDRQQRIGELARMLAGEKVTESARQHAQEMLTTHKI